MLTDEDSDANQQVSEYSSVTLNSSNKDRHKLASRGFDYNYAQLLATKLETFAAKKKLLLRLGCVDDWKIADPMSESASRCHVQYCLRCELCT